MQLIESLRLSGKAIDFFRSESSPFFPPPVTDPTFSRSFPTMKVSALLFAAAGFATASAIELTPDVSYTYLVSGGSLLLRHPPREPTDNNCRNEIRLAANAAAASTRNYPVMSSTSRAAQPKIRHGFPPTAGNYGSMRREIRGLSEPWEVICAVGLRPHRIRRRSGRPTMTKGFPGPSPPLSMPLSTPFSQLSFQFHSCRHLCFHLTLAQCAELGSRNLRQDRSDQVPSPLVRPL